MDWIGLGQNFRKNMDWIGLGPKLIGLDWIGLRKLDPCPTLAQTSLQLMGKLTNNHECDSNAAEPQSTPAHHVKLNRMTE